MIKERQERSHTRDVEGSGLKVVPITSAYILLARIRLQGISNCKRTGNVIQLCAQKMRKRS